MTRFPRAVWLLGWASFFTDTASEAIYPLLPIFLTRVLGAGALSIGLVEGAAEAANSVLRVVSGHLSDRWGVRKPIVIAGYSLSSATRPLIAIVTAWPQVLALRFVDRVGKGIRGAPRDAMLASVAAPGTRGLVFGFHRAMDHAGAVAGPLLASLFLLAFPDRYRTLFALTIVPGALAVFCLTLVREDHERASPAVAGVVSTGSYTFGRASTAGRTTATGNDSRPAPRDARHVWRRLPPAYYRLLGVILLFTLGNSTDAYLLLRLGDLGLRPAWIPIAWAALHVVKAATSVGGGALADRWGRRPMIALGWIVYAAVYAGFAAADTLRPALALFVVYGLYFGLAEGAEKALVADVVPADVRGAAFGLYSATLGVGAFLASVMFGLIWESSGAAAAFGVGASLALAASALLFVLQFRLFDEAHSRHQ